MFEEVTAPLFVTEWGRRLSFFFLFFFGMGLVISLLRSPWIWLSDYQLAHQTAGAHSATLNMADQASAFIAQIPKQHLFGHLDTSDTFIPITSLQLRLIGIILSPSKNESRAIISEAGQPGKIYHIGDRLPSGIGISSMTADGVILNNGGHLEKLPLQRAPLIFQEKSKKSLLGE